MSIEAHKEPCPRLVGSLKWKAEDNNVVVVKGLFGPPLLLPGGPLRRVEMQEAQEDEEPLVIRPTTTLDYKPPLATTGPIKNPL